MQSSAHAEQVVRPREIGDFWAGQARRERERRPWTAQATKWAVASGPTEASGSRPPGRLHTPGTPGRLGVGRTGFHSEATTWHNLRPRSEN
ncbi:hypothetical protein E2562_029429 [Oryza meyeriana var. granulata]|uniref:Uncharacterized protein n=1 Tax=Oryza meyeriana var. granulata TaxID=110450 RepID=A0A6G1BZG2_9ORYZ|nr:hypothetical protein E2562_029429 [Oryza meyeriana var. granulata]